VPFLHQTSLGDKFFPIRKLDVVLQVLLVLVPKPGWLVLFYLVLIEGKLRLYQRDGGFGMAHLPVLVFSMTEVQWGLHDWTVVPTALLGVRPQFYCTSVN
jgi:hypothetical protein